MRTVSFGLLLLVLLFAGIDATGRTRHVILDTDWWTDVDDACAVRILHRAEVGGLVKVDGICISAVRPTSVPSLRAFLDYEGWEGLAIGKDAEAVDYRGEPCYHDLLVRERPEASIPDDAQDAVDFYRSLLSSSRGKVDIVSVGFPNALGRLLESGPDEWSPLSGVELVRRKVKTLWMMAGKYPEGSEHNFNLSPRSRLSGSLVCSRWPGRIVFLGYEIGREVKVGATLDDSDLLRQVLLLHGNPDGRYAWDPLTAYMGICGSARKAGFVEIRGCNTVDPGTGDNTFVEAPLGRHSYVKFGRTPDEFRRLLDTILEEQAESGKSYP